MKLTRTSPTISRRQFLATTGTALAAPLIVPSSVLGANGQTPPSERIVMGAVGYGGQGPWDTDELMKGGCQMVAACDVDKGHLHRAVTLINAHYDNQDCRGYHDYRELMARNDIDAVMLAVPDHWHSLISTEAANHHKDIYGEKPLARTISEQQAIVRAVQKNNRIWQTGSWQRSIDNFWYACEIVRNGLIGNVTHVEVGLPGGQNSGHPGFGGLEGQNTCQAPPAELDYEFWVGPSEMVPYIACRVHGDWRWNYNTGGGQLMDWIGHHCDIAHWGLGFDNTGPSEVEVEHVEFPPPHAVWNTAPKYRVSAKYLKTVTGYSNDVQMTIAGTGPESYPDIKMGCKWIGSEGWIWVDRGSFDSSDPRWKKQKQLPDNLRKTELYRSTNHWRNFLECVRSRKPTITPVETAHHSAIPGHLALISMLTGRKLKWDVAAEQIVDDPDAALLLTRPYRAPWRLV
ncbi:MAG TPA: Gfo/Idh/MocA family oxidoreductase [Patescibacteria group bacterium]|nr:Gfo/Idh/MocA family oxidoreductase [Patescibacteria group bacterium]